MGDDRYDLGDTMRDDELASLGRPASSSTPRQPPEAEDPQSRRRRRRGASAGAPLKIWLVETAPRLLLVAAILWVVLLLHGLFPEAAASRALVDSHQGEAAVRVPQTVAARPSDQWTHLWPERPLFDGDQLQTASGSMTLRFSEGSSVILAPDTRVDLQRVRVDRGNAAIERLLALQRGRLAVSTGPPCGANSRFMVVANGYHITGWDAVYTVDIAHRLLRVGSGSVTVGKAGPGGTVVSTGQELRLDGQGPAAAQGGLAAEAARLPTGAARRVQLNDLARFQLTWLIPRSGWLLGIIGHQSGDGNPIARLAGGSARGECRRRLEEVRAQMIGIEPTPRSLRLDDLASLNFDQMSIPLIRDAFWRGQLMAYQVRTDGAWQIEVAANDPARTRYRCTRAGITEVGGR